MERVDFLTGYCRSVDGSRMVTVITEDGKLVEADCCYGACPYEPNCQIAQGIRERTAPGE